VCGCGGDWSASVEPLPFSASTLVCAGVVACTLSGTALMTATGAVFAFRLMIAKSRVVEPPNASVTTTRRPHLFGFWLL